MGEESLCQTELTILLHKVDPEMLYECVSSWVIPRVYATGPDGLPARVLRECAKELAMPVTLLVRKLLHYGHWPTSWRLHWVLPLHKRKAVWNPQNYRGVHLTAVLSKVVERVVLSVLGPYCQCKAKERTSDCWAQCLTLSSRCTLLCKRRQVKLGQSCTLY